MKDKIDLEEFWEEFVKTFMEIEKKWIIIITSFWIVISLIAFFLIDLFFYPDSTWFYWPIIIWMIGLAHRIITIKKMPYYLEEIKLTTLKRIRKFY